MRLYFILAFIYKTVMVWPGTNNQLDCNTVPDIQKYYLDGSNIHIVLIIQYINQTFLKKTLIFGDVDKVYKDDVYNAILLNIKYYIYTNRCLKKKLSFQILWFYSKLKPK
jgi:hypothetical protein